MKLDIEIKVSPSVEIRAELNAKIIMKLMLSSLWDVTSAIIQSLCVGISVIIVVRRQCCSFTWLFAGYYNVIAFLDGAPPSGDNVNTYRGQFIHIHVLPAWNNPFYGIA